MKLKINGIYVLKNGYYVLFTVGNRATKIDKSNVSLVSVGKSGSIYIKKLCYDAAKLMAYK